MILDYNAVETVYETHDHQILFGTNNGLYIYDTHQKTAKPFPGAQILENKVVGGIVEDYSGDISASSTDA